MKIKIRTFQSILVLTYNYLRMTEQEKKISESNQLLLKKLNQMSNETPLPKQQILPLILKLQLDDSDQTLLNQQLEKVYNNMLINTLNVTIDTQSKNWQDECKLGKTKIQALIQTMEIVFKSQQNKAVKKTSVINFIQNVLECLGVGDLTEVLEQISQQICSFSSSLEESDQIKLLRIINLLLKRISKTEDYHIRGKLHFTLTRFLPICHDSGFHHRAPLAHASDWDKATLSEDELKEDINQQVTYEFYQQFWEMQKYFLEIGELAVTNNSQGTSSRSNSEQLVTQRLKKIEFTLREMYAYFHKQKAKEVSEYYSQPLKFLKNFKLLPLQLKDPFFRKIIATQSLLFAFSLHHQQSKTAIPLNETDKKIIADIQNMGKTYLNTFCGVEGQQLYKELQCLFANELFWIDLKENWKDRKKIFVKKNENTEQKQKIVDIEKKKNELRNQINAKTKITGSNLIRFLQNKQPIPLLQSPTSTSFSYFNSQAVSCLNSFDYENGKQTEFESKAEYNMFEWKAMRSLYRENIREIWTTNERGDQKMKDYRLIRLMQKKQGEGEGQPSKKVKEN